MEKVNCVIGKKLAAIRKEKKMSQEVAGGLSGIQQRMLSRMERGLSSITVSNLISICSVYKVKASEIIEG